MKAALNAEVSQSISRIYNDQGFMTLAKLTASPVYYATVLQPVSRDDRCGIESRSIVCSLLPPKQADSNPLKEWLVTVLTIVGTAAAMWFVLTEGWFQLFGPWAS